MLFRSVAGGGGALAYNVGPESDEGSFVITGGANPGTVSFDHIEAVGPISGVSSATIVATNGDDDITIVARDSSTHAGTNGIQDFTVSVNNGPDLLFIDTPTLNVDALNGDDDIVVRVVAPNLAAWGVTVNANGGEPAASDTLIVEASSGADVIGYNVSSGTIGSGTITVNSPAATINFTTIEHAVIDGQGGSDALTVTTPVGADSVTYTPGAASDSGTIEIGRASCRERV